MYISPELRHRELHWLRGSGEASEGRTRGLQGVHRVPAPGPLFVKRLVPSNEGIMSVTRIIFSAP